MTVKNTLYTCVKSTAVLACILLGTLSASAGTISSFTATASPSTPFTVSGLTQSFTGGEAIVSGTVTCNSEVTCAGSAISFSLGVTGLSASTPVSAEIVGDASANASGLFVETSPISASIPFTVGAGSFDKTVFSSSLPAVGSLLITGNLNLTILAGQSITLPLNFFVGAQAVPEPSSFAFLGLGLLGLVAKFRRK